MGLNAGSVILASTESEREENNNRRELRFNVDCAISGIRGFATLSMKSYRTKFTVNRLALNIAESGSLREKQYIVESSVINKKAFLSPKYANKTFLYGESNSDQYLYSRVL